MPASIQKVRNATKPPNIAPPKNVNISLITLCSFVVEFYQISGALKPPIQTADKVKVSGQIFCKKPFQITRNMV